MLRILDGWKTYTVGAGMVLTGLLLLSLDEAWSPISSDAALLLLWHGLALLGLRDALRKQEVRALNPTRSDD